MYYTKQLAALRMEAFDRLHRPRESSSRSFLSSHTPSALSRAELCKSGQQHGQDGDWKDKHEPQHADASASGEGAKDSEGSGSEDLEDREEGFADSFHGRFDEPAREQQQAEYADERRLSEGSVVHEASVVHPPQCERAGSDSSGENSRLQGTVAQKENRDTRASGEIESLQLRHTQDLSQVVELDSKDLW